MFQSNREFPMVFALDLQSSFWQIPMAPNDVKNIIVIMKSSLYEWNVMLFGLKNAASTFSRTMADIFKDQTNQFLKVFVDGVNIHNRTWFKHLQHICLVLQKLAKVNLKLNPSKCCFGSKTNLPFWDMWWILMNLNLILKRQQQLRVSSTQDNN